MEEEDVFGLLGEVRLSWDKSRDGALNGHVVDLANLKRHKFSFSCCAFAAHDKVRDRFATIDTRGAVYAYSMKLNSYALVTRTHVAGTALAWSPLSKFKIVSGHADGSLRVLDAEKQRQMSVVAGAHRNHVAYVEFNAAGDLVVSADRIGAVLWRLVGNTLHKLCVLEPVAGHDEARFTGSVAFAASGRQHLAACLTSRVWIANAQTGQTVAEYDLPRSAPMHSLRLCATSTNGKLVCGVSNNDVLYFWDSLSKDCTSLPLPADVCGALECKFLTPSVVSLLTTTCLVFVDVNRKAVVLRINAQPSGDASRNFVACGISVCNSFATLTRKDGVVQLHDLNRAFAMHAAPQELKLQDEQQPQDAESRVEDRLGFLTQAKLQAMLGKYGCYPTRYRTTIWARLLRLPRNEVAFQALVARGTHESYVNLKTANRAVANPREMDVLRSVVSALANWSPACLADCDWLPGLVLPVIRVFGTDREQQVMIFETCATLVMNWCCEWFAAEGGVPLGVVNACSALLLEHDAELHRHFVECRINARAYTWLPLQTLLSLVLSRESWTIVMDHVLSNAPLFLHCVLVAYLRSMRVLLLALETTEELISFFAVEHVMHDIDAILKASYKLFASSSSSSSAHRFQWLGDASQAVFSSSSSSSTRATEAKYYPSQFQSGDSMQAGVRMTLQQLQRQQDEDAVRTTLAMEELRKSSNELKKMQAAYDADRDEQYVEEEARFKQVAVEKELRANERFKAEQIRGQARIEELKVWETDALHYFDRIKQISGVLGRKISQHMEAVRRQQEIQAESLREQEQLLAIEAEMQTKILSARGDTSAATEQQEWEQEIALRKESMAVKREAQIEAWKAQDELARQEITAFQQEQTRLDAHRKKLLVRAEFAQEALAVELDNERKIGQLARDRSLRILSQISTLAKVSHDELLAEREALLAKLETQSKEALLLHDQQFRSTQSAERERYLFLEKQRALKELALRQERTFELQQRQLRIDFEDKLREYHKEQKQKALDAEKKLSEEVLEIKQDGDDREFELRLLLQEQQKKERLGYQHILHEAEQQVILSERTKLARERAQHEAVRREEEETMLREHQERIHTLMQQRETQLREMNEQARSSLRNQELQRVEQEHAEHQSRLEQMREFQQQEENNLRQRLDRLNRVLDEASSSSSSSSPAATSPAAPPRTAPPSNDISAIIAAVSSDDDDDNDDVTLVDASGDAEKLQDADSSVMRRLKKMQREIDTIDISSSSSSSSSPSL